ncbi:CRISPR-associated protein, Cse1 family [Frankia casuarinae]|uniref:CRISPR-associated protein, Cse1 family n=1 Tax=Frankia casuarinae (strain DSM 45818 / CECT 9043 / HFP020203 / CcI3) TaxID=106370 RepID=Q2JH30_FRACC|nr:MULTISPECIES: type I-E CRISPR-associated protein Cse1/CasA [Frankia]ABD09412.1 CRISPR-associated protein, Cse1 family [Frankia casuarinae]ETA02741.1 CRISPR-associated protein, Cse1 family [Frankia sp. CcI6]EYT94186.1 CRISPR-associated protein, Cse1 family [Frankia casuarinae]KDA44378.1 CRISPR-associated protein, Cse1 family [Frankia sp. BMG5.23]KFB06820.1 CRISPR-associated protein, Cse1 family [Frankia sp. Allo2]
MNGFNLIDGQWIPVIKRGRRLEVGIRKALVDAHTIDGLALDDPLEAVAVLRQVLLPVVLDVFGAPRTDEEWSQRWEAGCFDRIIRKDRAEDEEGIESYLIRQAARFHLFHPTAPFAQVAGLRTAKDETKPVSLLVPRLASGNNVPLFSSRTENDPPSLTPAAAARALLAAHCWDTAAIKTGAADDPKVKTGKTMGNPTGPLGQFGIVLPLGETLFHTLMLSIPVLRHGLRQKDRPQWRSESSATSRWETRAPEGLLDLLTWQSRRIRLVPEADPTAVEDVSVRRVVLTAGDRLTGSVHALEPHTAWRQVDKPKADEPPVRPVRHQPGRSAWRGLEALLTTTPLSSDKVFAPTALSQLARLRDDGYVPDDLPLQVLTVGVKYGTQSAVIDEVMADEIPLPVTALARDSAVRETVLAVAAQAESLRIAANRLGDDLREAAGATDKLPWDKGQRLGEILIHSFNPTVHRLLAGLQQHPEDAKRAELAWRILARRLAWEVVDPVLSAAGPETFLGRDPGEPFGARLAGAEMSFRRTLNDVLGKDEDNRLALAAA